MRLWRICRKTFAKAALKEEGGLHASGRWHHRGIRVVYCAEHSFDRTLLPANWRTTPAPQALQDLGTSWLLLLNPEHPDAAKVRVVATVPFTFDPRLVADR